MGELIGYGMVPYREAWDAGQRLRDYSGGDNGDRGGLTVIPVFDGWMGTEWAEDPTMRECQVGFELRHLAHPLGWAA